MQQLTNRETIAGLALCLFGVAGLTIGARYTMGTASEMGPGYMPRLTAGGLVILGGLIVLRGLVAGAPRIQSLTILPLICVLGGIFAFGLLIPRAGLIVAVFATVLAGKLATDELGWLPALLLAAALSVLSFLLFVYFLGIPMRIIPD